MKKNSPDLSMPKTNSCFDWGSGWIGTGKYIFLLKKYHEKSSKPDRFTAYVV